MLLIFVLTVFLFLQTQSLIIPQYRCGQDRLSIFIVPRFRVSECRSAVRRGVRGGDSVSEGAGRSYGQSLSIGSRLRGLRAFSLRGGSRSG